MTITRAAGGVATGYLTAAGAATFGAALARQFAADHASASYGTDGLFADGVWISAADGALAASAAKAKGDAVGQTPQSARFPMHTVTVRGRTAAGRPDTGDLVFLYNAANNASGWDLEATLDVDMVSAACPSCRILVVEANGQAFSQFAVAEDTAVRLGAVAISNSYGARETGFSQSYAKAFDHPGHAIVVSAGDYGFTAASFPANLATVTSVGGTELSRTHNKRGWRETVWNSSGEGAGGSGCSAYVAKPSWQHDQDCPGRTVADVSALAWNVAIYNKNWGGWGLVGGTSASSPIIAGVYGLAGNAATVRPGYEYAHATALFDVTTGNNDWFFSDNGAVCGDDYLCVAKKGYDAPSGLGAPDGIGAF